MSYDPQDSTSAIPVSIGPPDTGREIRDAVRDLFEIYDVTYGIGRANAIRFRGRLLMDSGRAYDIIDERFRRLDYTPLFRRDGEADVILAVRTGARVASSRTTVALVLLALTIVSMLFAGANGNVVESRGWFWGLLSGWPFAVSLIVILLAHESGHYFMARHYGVPVSLPYFIPMPFSVLGTMGAFIQMKAPPKNRRQLLAIAVGPGSPASCLREVIAGWWGRRFSAWYGSRRVGGFLGDRHELGACRTIGWRTRRLCVAGGQGCASEVGGCGDALGIGVPLGGLVPVGGAEFSLWQSGSCAPG